MSTSPRESRIVAAVFAGVMTFAFSTAVAARPFPEIFIFGDSFSDTGNAYAATFGLYPPDPPYYDGRFSDGPVWVEYLASALDLTITANGGDPWQINGNNFAVGGARAAVDIPIFTLTIPSVLTQVSAFLAGAAPIPTDALYVMFIGSNDALAAADPANGYTLEEQEQLIQEAVDAVAASITDLASNGATYFLVPNLPDWGQSPAALLVNSNSVEATWSTMRFNELLADELAVGAHALDIVIFTANAFELHLQIIDDALNHGGAEYGITNVYTPIFEGSAGSPGADPATSLFADDLHWSTVAQSALADTCDNALSTSPDLLRHCLAGPATAVAAACELVDADADNDVDLVDVAAFQELFVR